MGLREYERKRDFKRTPEPRGRVHARRGKLRYVIQKHAASRLHYDFRLELDGVLKSWAVPKGPSLDPKEKRLAVEVEDHPIEYGTFEGTIPEGEYGGGTVMLWDRGTWTPLEDGAKDYAAGRLKFELEGERLRGGWMLVRMGGRAHDSGRNWLLIKEKDEHARPQREGDVLEREPKSVASGRTMDEIAGHARGRVWHSNKPAKAGGRLARRRAALGMNASRSGGDARPDGGLARRTTRAARRAAGDVIGSERRRPSRAVDPARVPGAKRGALPESLEPEKATLVKEAPEGDAWLHEVKYDGYRILARIERGKARLLSRRGLDWSSHFDEIGAALARLPAEKAVLDGEVVALAADGTSRFQLLQNALGGGAAPLVYYVFDLLHLDGWDLRGATLADRKRALAALVPGGEGAVRFSDHVTGRGPAFHRQACGHGLEGIVSKRADAPYRSGRGRDWLKVKCLARQEFVIGGWTDPEGARSGFGSLLLGVHDDQGRLQYAGKVGTGFDDATLRELSRRFKALARDASPFVNAPRARDTHWLKPELVGEVSFTEWTNDGRLRHPAFRGLRSDKPAKEIVRERAEIPPGQESAETRSARKLARAKAADRKQAPSSDRPRSRRSRGAPPEQRSTVRDITNLDKVLWPDIRATKGEMAAYYESIAERMLPEIATRPLMIKRCPEGIQAHCFFQKHVNNTTSKAVGSVKVRESDGMASYLMVEDLAGLMGLVQMGSLEIHIWGSRAKTVEKPDRMVFDLDPDPSVEWPAVIAAAGELRGRLQEIGLESVLMTTGGKGLHVIVPLAPKADWDAVREFSRRVAEAMVDESPERYTATLSKAKRRGRILVDWLRNGRGSTAIAPWSTRARPGAPVATPIAWEELKPGLAPNAFTIRNLTARLARQRRDPWAGAHPTRQALTATLLRTIASR